MEKTEQRGFEDLECYRLALTMLKQAYGLAKRLPAVERYNLADQMRRSATSAMLNIAEGYGRYYYLNSLRFFYIARGSLMETLSAFVSCEAVGYITSDELAALRQLAHSALRSLNGYIRYVKNQQQGQQEYGDQAIREVQPIYITIPNVPEDD
jgi:four helix bundle protein